jgi:midasin (ATPase involved in ribosome maturation)
MNLMRSMTYVMVSNIHSIPEIFVSRFTLVELGSMYTTMKEIPLISSSNGVAGLHVWMRTGEFSVALTNRMY